MNRLLLLISALICFATCRSSAESVGSSSGIDKLREASGRERRLDDPSVVGLVLDVSGDVASGFDKGKTRRARRQNAQDFDVLRALVVVADLVDALNGGDDGLDDITVFAPNDRAFFLLARDLGYTGRYDEEVFYNFLVEALTGLAEDLEVGLVDLITNVLTYHVGVGSYKVQELRQMRTTDTALAGSSLKFGRARGGLRTIVADASGRPRRRFPKISKTQLDIPVSSGFVHVVNKVLLPLAV